MCTGGHSERGRNLQEYAEGSSVVIHNCKIFTAGFPSIGFVREFCNWETFMANCTNGYVIQMTSARYGRMKFGRCIKNFLNPETLKPVDIGCSENIIK